MLTLLKIQQRETGLTTKQAEDLVYMHCNLRNLSRSTKKFKEG